MNILVTGYDGYIGSVLTPMLIQRGYNVVGLDTGYYSSGSLYNEVAHPSKIIRKDIRNISKNDFDGVDVVVHLAELSNDPSGELNPDITRDINLRGSVALAECAKKSGVKRFIYSSSCSVYGVANEDLVDERSPLNPQTVYAECKVKVEKALSKLADENFSPVFLRNATAFGPSPRMRFDLVFNNLSGIAWLDKEIRMTSDGTPWRPLVHVLDISNAIICSILAENKVIHDQIFNVGNTEFNYRIRDIATVISETFKCNNIKFGNSDNDNRSYRVSFDKINESLPGFSCEWDLEKSSKQVFDLFSNINLDESSFNDRSFTRVNQLKYLIESKKIDSSYYWVN